MTAGGDHVTSYLGIAAAPPISAVEVLGQGGFVSGAAHYLSLVTAQ